MFNAKKLVAAFVLSAPRSGSTWFNSVIGSNSWGCNLGEYHRPFNIPGHVACRLCEADGLPECTRLYGIHDILPRDAFHFAARRLGKSVLIDASKSLEWCKEFLGREDIDVKLIHLVRNPCGFIESQGRRHPELSNDELLVQWEDTNCKIEEFIAASDRSRIMACYDDLADEPNLHFPRVCHFIGFEWEPDATNYWQVPHHGLGANGAASLYLRNRQQTVYLTGEDMFYADLTARRTASDKRWVDRLPAEFSSKCINSPYACHLQRRLPTDWSLLFASNTMC